MRENGSESRHYGYYGYGGGSGYAYKGYYGGYYPEHGGAGEDDPLSRITNFLFLLRERFREAAVVALVFFAGVIILTFNSTNIYESSASVQVLRHSGKRAKFEEVVQNNVLNSEDFNTMAAVFESGPMIARVKSRLDEKQLRRLLEPYGENSRPESVLKSNRAIRSDRQSLLIWAAYRHPDPKTAALIANLFAEEFISYNNSLRVQGALDAHNDLKLLAGQQKEKVKEIERELVKLKEENKNLSFREKIGPAGYSGPVPALENIHADSGMIARQMRQIMTRPGGGPDSAGRSGLAMPKTLAYSEEMQYARQNEILAEKKKRLDEAEAQWRLIEHYRKTGRPLWQISAIAGDPHVAELLSRRSHEKIELAGMEKRYRHKHPRLIRVRNAFTQTGRELDKAVQAAAGKIRHAYQGALNDYETAQVRAEEKMDDIIGLEKARIEYNALLRKLEVNKQMHRYLYDRMQQTLLQTSEDNQNIHIVDRAVPALLPCKPNIPLNLALGAIGGLLIGFGFAAGKVLLDDKVKTAYDVEGALSLPLLCIVPSLNRDMAADAGRAVQSGKNNRVKEAFLNLYTAAHASKSKKSIKVLLVTSTIPGEGKTFAAANTALTFADQGEKVLLIDADLRIPNVARSLGLEPEGGLIRCLENDEENWRAHITTGVHPNCHILSSGGRTGDPGELFCGERFGNLLFELRREYDRVIIDTPPLAPVSDTFHLLRHSEGVIYVIRHNCVSRKVAQAQLRRMANGGANILGAIMNNLSPRLADYYYSHYYDKSCQDYYLDVSAEGATRGEPETRTVQQAG